MFVLLQGTKSWLRLHLEIQCCLDWWSHLTKLAHCLAWGLPKALGSMAPPHVLWDHECIMSPLQLHTADCRQLLRTDIASRRGERCERDRNLSFLLPLSDIYNRLIRGTASFRQISNTCAQETYWTAMKSSVVWANRRSHRGPGRCNIDFEQDHLRSSTYKAVSLVLSPLSFVCGW